MTINNPLPPTHESLAKQGADFFRAGQIVKAYHAYLEAVLMAPEETRYRFSLIRCLTNIRTKEHNYKLQQAILLCLLDDDIPPQSVALIWLEQLFLDPTVSGFKKLTVCDDYDAFLTAFDHDVFVPLLNNKYFLAGLRKCVIKHTRLENLLIHLRQFYLLRADAAQKEAVRPFLCALACKAFLTDYIFPVSDEEQDAVLHAEESFKDLSVTDQIILGCYRPLYEIDGATALFDYAIEQQAQDLLHLTVLQIDEPIEEQELRQEIQVIGTNSINKPLGLDLPYPRWFGTHPARFSLNAKMIREKLDILYVGCATGQNVAVMAQHTPNAQLDAVDASLAQLGYAKRRIHELGVENIRFLCVQPENMKDLDKTYDLIYAAGALQNVESPTEELSNLTHLMKPAGVMRLALLSDVGLANIKFWRNHIAAQGYKDDYDGIQRLRHDIMHSDIDPLYQRIMKRDDLYSVMGIKRLLFAPHEHGFNFEKIMALLDEAGLRPLKVKAGVPALEQQYKKRFPQDFKKTDLKNWAILEQEVPDAFITGYDLVLVKKPSFEGDELPLWYRNQE